MVFSFESWTIFFRESFWCQIHGLCGPLFLFSGAEGEWWLPGHWWQGAFGNVSRGTTPPSSDWAGGCDLRIIRWSKFAILGEQELDGLGSLLPMNNNCFIFADFPVENGWWMVFTRNVGNIMGSCYIRTTRGGFVTVAKRSEVCHFACPFFKSPLVHI